MTVSYNLDVSSSTSWTFLRLAFRWRGSIWKAVFSEVLSWLVCYYIVFCIYRFALGDDQQKMFGLFAQQCDKKLEWIPLTFMLGFFVTIVVDRWKSIFQNIGFIDNAALYTSAYLRGQDLQTRILRRSIVRYLCLTQVLVLRDVSVPVRKRFPTLESIVDAGFMDHEEKEMLERVKNGYSRYWVPINWVFTIVVEQRSKGKIAADIFCNMLLQEVRLFRDNLQFIVNYDWVPVPLAYPQVVFLAVRVYFFICIFSRQYILPHGDGDDIVDKQMNLVGELADVDTAGEMILDWAMDTYIPFMTILQMFFYMGWLKVAEGLLNPLGEDDDDFETNFLVDRNLAIAMSIVDECHGQHPKPKLDSFYRTDSRPHDQSMFPSHPLIGSAAQLTDDNAVDDGRKMSFSAAAVKAIQRRMSRAMSISHSEEKHPEEGWTQTNGAATNGTAKPPPHPKDRSPSHVSEVTALPTIHSIEEESTPSSSSSSSFDDPKNDDPPPPRKITPSPRPHIHHHQNTSEQTDERPKPNDRRRSVRLDPNAKKN